jgi:hypothetical protein
LWWTVVSLHSRPLMPVSRRPARQSRYLSSNRAFSGMICLARSMRMYVGQQSEIGNAIN